MHRLRETLLGAITRLTAGNPTWRPGSDVSYTPGQQAGGIHAGHINHHADDYWEVQRPIRIFFATLEHSPPGNCGSRGGRSSYLGMLISCCLPLATHAAQTAHRQRQPKKLAT